jgi:hypothetical protein
MDPQALSKAAEAKGVPATFAFAHVIASSTGRSWAPVLIAFGERASTDRVFDPTSHDKGAGPASLRDQPTFPPQHALGGNGSKHAHRRAWVQGLVVAHGTALLQVLQTEVAGKEAHDRLDRILVRCVQQIFGLSPAGTCRQVHGPLSRRTAAATRPFRSTPGQAHRQLVIHCDIKPDNVRVSADGQAKLLDFGIAQLQGQTDERGAAFTPGFASPQQMAGQPPSIAGDVYGLGRLLEAIVDPVLHGQRRHLEQRAVIARATAEDPGARYDSVDALRRDVRHWLAHRPVAAMPGGLVYRMAKLLRRRWAWATVATTAVGLTAAFTWQLAGERNIAQAERQRAESEVQTTRETARLLMSMFTGADPQKMGLPEIPKSIPLAAGRERLQQQMAADPNTRARLQMILGDVYERIGRLPEAADAFRTVAEL